MVGCHICVRIRLVVHKYRKSTEDELLLSSFHLGFSGVCVQKAHT